MDDPVQTYVARKQGVAVLYFKLATIEHVINVTKLQSLVPTVLSNISPASAFKARCVAIAVVFDLYVVHRVEYLSKRKRGI